MSGVLAILGGGQLAQMLGAAAAPLGVRCRALSPSADACAARTCEMIVGDFDDPDAFNALVDGATALTFEFENVPASLLHQAESLGIPARPNARALRTASDRLVEKQFFESIGMAVPPYMPIASDEDLDRASAMIGFPMLLKARSGGYDGKSQARVDCAGELRPAWASISHAPCLAERRVRLLSEFSVIACRDVKGTIHTYPLTNNEHRAGILVRSEAPANASADDIDLALSWARSLAESLKYVGVIALELFLTDQGLCANEFAPRVHNTGHWTIEGAETSQFENHVRAAMGMALGSARPTGFSIMRNLIGNAPTSQPRDRSGTWHLYGKQARPGRKLGHVTVTAQTRDEALVREASLRLP